MKVFVDIETIPDQSEGALEKIVESIDVRCPHKTKADIGKDLGLAPNEIKFTGAEDLKQKWIAEKGNEAAKLQAEEKWLKTSFDGAYGEIICIGLAVDDGEVCVLKNEDGEKALLDKFWSTVILGKERREPQVIAHNANFDLPFIWHRTVIHGVHPSFDFNPYARQGSRRYCTMEAWAGFKGMIGLDRLCSILGVDGDKGGMSGADVWPEYKAGNLEKIANYCANDVELLRKVYNRLTFN